MKDLELNIFQIISYAGSAKSNYIEAMRIARTGDFKKAQNLIEDGIVEYQKAHKSHLELVSDEANGENLGNEMLLMHAEDQLMSADIFQVIAKEHIELIKMIKENND